jgi:hypothetical protein
MKALHHSNKKYHAASCRGRLHSPCCSLCPQASRAPRSKPHRSLLTESSHLTGVPGRRGLDSNAENGPGLPAFQGGALGCRGQHLTLPPEMARLIASGSAAGAHAAQSRAAGFTLVLALPCAVAFLIVPDLIMCALFARAALTGLLAALRTGATKPSSTSSLWGRAARDAAGPTRAAVDGKCGGLGWVPLLAGARSSSQRYRTHVLPPRVFLSECHSAQPQLATNSLSAVRGEATAC